MKQDRLGAFDAFLIEDVILTLANIQATLGWLTGGGVSDDMRLSGLARIGRQVEMLAERAQRHRHPADHAASAGAAAWGDPADGWPDDDAPADGCPGGDDIDNIFAAPDPGGDAQDAPVRPGCGTRKGAPRAAPAGTAADAAPSGPVFRSRRPRPAPADDLA